MFEHQAGEADRVVGHEPGSVFLDGDEEAPVGRLNPALIQRPPAQRPGDRRNGQFGPDKLDVGLQGPFVVVQGKLAAERHRLIKLSPTTPKDQDYPDQG